MRASLQKTNPIRTRHTAKYQQSLLQLLRYCFNPIELKTTFHHEWTRSEKTIPWSDGRGILLFRTDTGPEHISTSGSDLSAAIDGNESSCGKRGRSRQSSCLAVEQHLALFVGRRWDGNSSFPDIQSTISSFSAFSISLRWEQMRFEFCFEKLFQGL